MRVGFDPYDESPIKRRGEEYIEHEFHDGPHAYERATSKSGTPYDYEGYPNGRRPSSQYSRSRPGTPVHSPSSAYFPSSTVHDGGRSRPEMLRQTPGNVSSPSPLLRRATTQPTQLKNLKQPNFVGPPTAPHTSSMPRPGALDARAQSFRSSAPPDTPPSSIRKQE
jgi:hypothetical protein